MEKNLVANEGDMGSIPGSDEPGHGGTKSQTQLSTQTPKQKLSSTLQVAEELVWVQALQILEGILRILDLILKALK